MRMQNAEMEFVTFDAQDVIATSGPMGTGNPLAVQMGALNAYNKAHGDTFFNKSGNTSGISESRAYEWLVYYIGSEDANGITNAEKGPKDSKPTDKPDYIYVYADDNDADSKLSNWLMQQGRLQ